MNRLAVMKRPCVDKNFENHGFMYLICFNNNASSVFVNGAVPGLTTSHNSPTFASSEKEAV